MVNIMDKKGIDGVKVVLIVLVALLVVAIGYLAVSVILIQRETKLIDQSMENLSENSSDSSDTIQEIDLSKGLNTDSTYSNVSSTLEDYGLSVKTNGGKTVNLTIDWSKFRTVISSLNIAVDSYPTSTDTVVLDGFQKNVRSAFIGEVGKDASGVTLVFLMEDSTLEYKKLFVQEKDSEGKNVYRVNFDYVVNESSNKISFKNGKSISGVSGVVKLYRANLGKSKTILASRRDGSYYDLIGYLNS